MNEQIIRQVSLGEHAFALQRLEDALSVQPGDMSTRRLAASVAAAGEYWQESRKHWLRVVQDGACDVMALAGLATACHRTGAEEIAAGLWERVVDAHPGSTSARMSLARTYTDAGHTDKALTIYATIAEYEPEQAEIWYEMGLLFQSEERYADAKSAFHQALRISPQFSRAQAHLAETFLKTGWPREAFAHATAAIQRDGTLTLAAVVLAEMAIDDKDSETALKHIESILNQHEEGPYTERARTLHRQAEKRIAVTT